MHILLFIHSLGAGGAERVTVNLANHWSASGRTVTLVTLAGKDGDFYQLHPAVKRVALKQDAASGGMLRALWHNLQRVKALRAAIRAAQPDVVVSMMSTANILLALAAGGLSGVRTIGAEHTYPPQLPLGGAWEALRRRTYGRLSALVALTEEGAQWLRGHSSARRVVVIPNAAFWPLADQTPLVAPDTVCMSGRRILLAVGRLSEEKNFDLLIAAFAALAARHRQWDLVILGDGPQREQLERCVAEAGLQGRVLLPGRVGNVGAWYARAHLYVMTSRYEGFPNTLVEAMSYGLPAVSFDCDTGPRDIIRHGIDGLLVPPGDRAGLEQALDGLMGNEAVRTAYAVQAEQARERFSVERISAMWEQLFAQCGRWSSR